MNERFYQALVDFKKQQRPVVFDSKIATTGERYLFIEGLF